MLQLLHPLAWCEFAISVSFLPREHRLMCAARRSDAQCAYQRLPTRLTGRDDAFDGMDVSFVPQAVIA
jgi:hypothetical protein